MNIIKYFLSLSFLMTMFTIAGDTFPLKDHEKWWDAKCRDKKRLEEVSQWWGGENAISRLLVRLHIANKEYKSILDIPCGLAVDYDAFKRSCPEIHYLGIDLASLFVAKATERAIPAVVARIQEIPCKDSSFEVVYSRHILEHLDTYKDALKEMVRVAQKEVIVVFFINPNDTSVDKIIPVVVDGYPINHNRYSKSKIEEFLNTLEKVKSYSWQAVKNKDECILHIVVSE